ncbi:MAG: hypothetical protein O3B41_03300 [Bacteroidetes bacterium]|nr:hypothetical protein [Bacteroidota bacterium]
MRVNSYLAAVMLWGASLILLTSGCEESVSPILGTEEAFSFYGYFNPRADTQAVRVYSIDGILNPEGHQKLNAIVTSRNKRTGETIVWRDSTVVFRNETIGHVFYALFRPEHNTEYSFQAEGTDGRISLADLKMPADGATDLVSIVSTRSNVLVELKWNGVPRILQTAVTYKVRVPFPDGTDTTTVRVRILSGRLQELGSESWKVVIIPSSDIGAIYTRLGLRPGISPILLDDIEVSAFVVSADWVSPTGAFDSELLVQPGVFDNVTGGFGFIGSGYTDRFVFELTDKQKQDAGFAVK